MRECEFLESCPFFNGLLAEKPVDVEKLKSEYCLTNNLRCARYIITMAVGENKIPEDLYPHEKEIAYKVIAENS